MKKVKLFYISTAGSSASTWLARTLSMHEEIIVSHGSEIPPFTNPNEFLEYYSPLLERSQFLLGAIHMSDAHGCRMRRPIINFAAHLRVCSGTLLLVPAPSSPVKSNRVQTRPDRESYSRLIRIH